MSNYAIFFKVENMVYQLPVNPEEIAIASVMAIEKYEVLKIGQIAVPTYLELTEYSFEVELPHEPYHYVETSGDFRDTDFYLNLFKEWREELAPVRFIAVNGITNDINSLVLIEEVREVEKAGEEGDKYISFKLLEYREFGAKKVVQSKSVRTAKQTNTAVIKRVGSMSSNPKNTGTYVVKPGDTLYSIAMLFYHDGRQTIKIFNANKNLIKNPALIYPGWKLVIPK